MLALSPISPINLIPELNRNQYSTTIDFSKIIYLKVVPAPDEDIKSRYGPELLQIQVQKKYKKRYIVSSMYSFSDILDAWLMAIKLKL